MVAPVTTVGEVIGELAAVHGGDGALAHGAHVVTYDDLDRWAGRVAARLQEAGVMAGQRVAVIGMNQPWVVAALLGAWRIGAVPVPLSARLRSHDLAQVLNDARPVALLSAAAHGSAPLVGMLQGLVADVPTMGPVWVVDDATGEPHMALRGPATVDGDVLTADIALVGYTSGTTGRPKGALIRHSALVRSAHDLGDVLGLGQADTTALAVPWSHAFGLVCLLAALASGGRVALVDATRTTQGLRAAIIEREAGVVHGSPLLFARLRGGAPLPPEPRRGFVAGAPCHRDLLRDLDQAGMRILNLFGMTELGAVSVTRPDDPAEVRYETVGRPVCAYQVRTLAGELHVRGPSTTPGYLGDPQQTADVLDDGWFRTGDLADIDEAGNITVRGRRDDIVNVAGFNVSPAEVEAVLLGHPDISAAVVVGLPGPTGEALAAFVVPRSASSQIAAPAVMDHVRGRLAGYKVPYRVTVLPSLPLLPAGKPDRAALRERWSPASHGEHGS